MFQAILSKMQTVKGTVQVGGTIAYVPQTPWVQNLTLKDNILFGLEYDEQKYREVIHAAALELDLQILPKGEHHRDNSPNRLKTPTLCEMPTHS